MIAVVASRQSFVEWLNTHTHMIEGINCVHISPDDIQKANGYEFSSIVMDEVADISNDDWERLQARRRLSK